MGEGMGGRWSQLRRHQKNVVFSKYISLYGLSTLYPLLLQCFGMQNDLQFRGGGWGGGESSVICVHTAHPPAFQPTEVDFQSAVGSSRVQMSSRANLQYDIHCKKNWSENKSPFGIPIPPIVFSISLIQNLCSSPLAFLTIIEVGIKTLTLLMETNPIS